MPEQHLNGAQVGAGFEQMRGPTVTQGVRRDTLSLACWAASRQAIHTILSVTGRSAVRRLRLGNKYTWGLRQRQYSRRVPAAPDSAADPGLCRPCLVRHG